LSRLTQKDGRGKRTYNSKRRQEQALLTQRVIIDAARKLFIGHGYNGATMDMIAQEAGVAVETVYANFGNKRAVLSRLVDISIVGDDEPVTLFQREGPQAVFAEKDQYRQVQLFSIDMTNIMSRMAPLFEIMRAAAKTEPDISTMLQKILHDRVGGMKVFLRAVLSNGPLRNGLTLEQAAETVWAVSSGEVFSLLVMDRGWSQDKYQKWLADSLTRLILN
jgi:TetR/AcrR family transcriptional regulator, regulator of autoinduction and epiphytic fitness